MDRLANIAGRFCFLRRYLYKKTSPKAGKQGVWDENENVIKLADILFLNKLGCALKPVFILRIKKRAKRLIDSWMVMIEPV